MAFEGYIDQSSTTEIYGWIYDNMHPEAPLEVEILNGEEVLASVTADGFRADLAAAGKGNGKHAFRYTASNAAAASLTARVAGKTWRIPPTGKYDLSRVLPNRFEATLHHSLEYGLPVALDLEGFTEAPSQPTDVDIAKRVMRAYIRAVENDPAAGGLKRDQWTEVAEAFHREVVDLIHREDAPGLGQYLRNAHAKGITYGITQGEQTTGVLKANPDARRLVLLAVLDYLTSLAEFIGVLDVECAEQHGQWAENIHRDPLKVVDQISTAIGIDLVPPQAVGSGFGLKTERGVLTTRDLLASFAALRIKALLRESTNLPNAVCEIGGGLGGTALYSHLLGVASYTIIDLPLIGLLQGFYLLSSLPSVKMQLYGEEESGASIRLLPTYAFANGIGPVGVMFNQDSFPEMHRDYSVGYVRTAGQHGIPTILSINQEARAMQHSSELQTVAREVVREAGGYCLQSRNRHWLKGGYVEEVYRRLS